MSNEKIDFVRALLSVFSRVDLTAEAKLEEAEFLAVEALNEYLDQKRGLVDRTKEVKP